MINFLAPLSISSHCRDEDGFLQSKKFSDYEHANPRHYLILQSPNLLIQLQISGILDPETEFLAVHKKGHRPLLQVKAVVLPRVPRTRFQKDQSPIKWTGSSSCTAENKRTNWETPPLTLFKIQCSVLVSPHPSAGNSSKRRNPFCKNGKTEVSCYASSNISSGFWAVKAFRPSCPRTSCFFETDSLFSSHCV